MFLPNGVAGAELFFAIAQLGAVAIGVNTRYRADDLRHLLDVSQATVLVSADHFLGIDFEAIVTEAVSTLAAPPHVVWPDGLQALSSHGRYEADDARPEDLVVAFTTSGTTGRPKLAAHDHDSLVHHVDIAARAFDVGPDDAGLLIVPLCGTFGLITMLCMLAGGARLVMPDHFEAATAASLLAAHRVTHINGSDDMLLAMIGAARCRWAGHQLLARRRLRRVHQPGSADRRRRRSGRDATDCRVRIVGDLRPAGPVADRRAGRRACAQRGEAGRRRDVGADGRSRHRCGPGGGGAGRVAVPRSERAARPSRQSRRHPGGVHARRLDAHR